MSTKYQGNIDSTSRISHKKLIITSAALILAAPTAGFAYQASANSRTSSDAISVQHSSSTTAIPSQEPTDTAHAETTVDVTANNADVTVNGQHIDVPENGSITQFIESDDGSVEVQATSSGQAFNSNNTSMNISVDAHSSSGSSNTRSTSNVNITQH